MLVGSDYIEKNEKYRKLFYLFLKHKNLKYPEILEKINEDMKLSCENYVYYDLKEIRTIINYIKKNSSTTKADIMDKILYNSMNDDKKEVVVPDGLLKHSIKFRPVTTDMNVVDEIKKDMDVVIKENKSSKELYNEGKIKRSSLFSDVKKYIKYIEVEKYMEFLHANYNIQPTTIKELTEFSYLIKYFIVNLESNVSKLNSLDPKKDEEAIKNFNVSIPEDLDGHIKNNIGRLYIYKLQKLESLLERYSKLDKVIDTIIQNKNITKFDKLIPSDLKKLKEDEEFVIEYYEELKDIKKIYDIAVKSLVNLKDTSKKEIETEFTKKFLLGNNN